MAPHRAADQGNSILVDRIHSRYREYDPEQLSEIASILALRELGLPL